jgi:EAL domain-containing protein (putative c-di-GMP-specific phosphodiesterase class I)
MINESPSRKHAEESKRLLASWLDLEALHEENRQLRRLLYEQLTHLPVTGELVARLEVMLKETRQAVVFYFNTYMGTKTAELPNLLKETESRLTKVGLDTATIKAGRDFVILATPASEPPRSDEMAVIYEEIKIYTGQINCAVGIAPLEETPAVRLERLVEEALNQAIRDATAAEPTGPRALSSAKTLREEFTPIFNFESGQVIAYEALSADSAGRPVKASELFRQAIESDFIASLDRLHHEMTNLGNLLFVNLDPSVIGLCLYRECLNFLLTIPPQLRLGPVVFVIEEQSVTESFDYFRLLCQYVKASGFRVSIAGIKNPAALLEIMTDIKPGFIQLDPVLLKGIESDEAKQESVKGILTFVSRASGHTIAQDVTTPKQLDALIKIGVRFGQGPQLTPKQTD